MPTPIQTTIPFLIRMKPDIREMLKRASADQRRSMASLIEECVRERLTPTYGNNMAEAQQ